MPALDSPVLVERQRAWTDEAHISPHDVHELGNLVDVQAPDRPSDPSHPRVIGDLEHAVGLVQMHEVVALALGAVDHAPELEHLERLAVAPGARLTKEDRPERIELDRDRGYDQDGGEDDQRRARAGEVEGALDHV
jgi:hypothetical protein